MSTYKGNRGNLLQHWVLAEALIQLRGADLCTLPLCFVDAHSMSPYARRCKEPGLTAADYDSVANKLPGQRSVFECAWQSIVKSRRDAYPSSAAFVQHLWSGELRMVLCEVNATTADEIDRWRGTIPATTDLELHRGDWRQRFRRDFPERVAAYVFSFDPYMINRHWPTGTPKVGNMYPRDFLRVGAALVELPDAPVVVQKSTYSANNANAQADVQPTVEPILRAAGLRLRSTVTADGNMMSLVFSRDLDSVNLDDLSERFADWLREATAVPS